MNNIVPKWPGWPSVRCASRYRPAPFHTRRRLIAVLLGRDRKVFDSLLFQRQLLGSDLSLGKRDPKFGRVRQQIDRRLIWRDAFLRLAHRDVDLAKHFVEEGVVGFVFNQARDLGERSRKIGRAHINHRARVAGWFALVRQRVAIEYLARRQQIADHFRFDHLECVD